LKALMPMHRFLIALLLCLTACTASNENLVLPTLAPDPDSVRSLPYWETVSGEVLAGAPNDYWTFVGDAGAPIFIAVVSRGAEYQLRLYLAESLIAEGQRIEMQLPASDLYRLEVSLLSGAGAYDLGLGYTDRPNPNDPTPLPATVGVPTPTPAFAELGEFMGSLSTPTTYAEFLTAESPIHVYTLQGREGAVVSFELYRIAGTLDPLLRLYDSEGNLIAEDDNALGEIDARLLNITLTSAGLYSVQVSGKGLYGDYSLVFKDGVQAVNPDPRPTLAPTTVAPYVTPTVGFALPDARLDDHVPAINALVREGDFQRFSFQADAGETVSVVVAPMAGSTLLPQLEIFNPVGEQIAIAQASTSPNASAAVMGLGIIETGTHTLIITGENSSAGQFTVAYGRGLSVRDVFIGTALSGIAQEQQINEVGSRHVWQLFLNPRDIITVAVRPDELSAFDPVIELVTAEGELIYRDDNSGGNRTAVLNLAEIYEPATYLLRVYDATGNNVGGYTLLWRYVNLAPTQTAIPALTTLMDVEDLVTMGNYKFFAFQGQAGQEILIEVIAEDGSALDPVLVLLAPSGGIIAEADDSNRSLNPSLRLSLPESGSYNLRVNGYLSEGRFRVRVALLLD
jgi:hypothetical protein